MYRVIVIYASMSGNTELMAKIIAESVIENGLQVEVKDCWEVLPEELLKYDGILLGTYTWGEGALPDEFLDLYEELDGLDFTTKKGAVFGSGSSMYPYFARAVDLLTEKLQKCGAEMILPPLKIELSPTEKEQSLCREFGKQFSEKVIKL
ncbi:flavodoxin [Fredinandcohnia sp. 179-A 10B2 NHS]|uniref:flavodoxin n=1 Tax=Fredinandcohnia sp. 179-A 10B2 NHS TaxID=3235176 RepID=UPI00399F5F8F